MTDAAKAAESHMYRIMGALSRLPIIFKGAMITNLVLEENGFDEFERGTMDINANWTDGTPDMEMLTKELNDALKDIDIQVKAFRSYGEKKSFGFAFYRGNDLITTMDMDVGRKIAEDREYRFFDYSFRGSASDQIITDKTLAVSSEKIFRRVKDVIDLYALLSCCRVDINDIYRITKAGGRKFDDFQCFFERKEELRNAYDKLKRIDHKPEFDEVYQVVSDFVLPISKHAQGITWDGTGWDTAYINVKERFEFGEDPVTLTEQQIQNLIKAFRSNQNDEALSHINAVYVEETGNDDSSMEETLRRISRHIKELFAGKLDSLDDILPELENHSKGKIFRSLPLK